MPIRVRVGQQSAVKVVSSLSGSKTLNLSGLNDVSASSLENGMVLVYNSTTSKWDATLSLTPGVTQNLDINGGSF
tara:strand:- start:24 stop:248 length:225 start_codon:yes stop_codon:yes gene_type:complete